VGLEPGIFWSTVEFFYHLQLATVSTGIGLPQNLHIDVVGILGIHSRSRLPSVQLAKTVKSSLVPLLDGNGKKDTCIHICMRGHEEIWHFQPTYITCGTQPAWVAPALAIHSITGVALATMWTVSSTLRAPRSSWACCTHYYCKFVCVHEQLL